MSRNPFLIDGPTCISLSGGRTSGYMLWRVLEANQGLPDQAVVLFANTGKEREETLEFVRDIGAQWQVPITWLEYRSANPREFAVVDFATASRHGEPFRLCIEHKRFLPNPTMRFCTSELKIRTMHAYLRTRLGWDYWDAFVGLRADEQRRVARLGDSKDTRETRYAPLAVAGEGRFDVQEFWQQQAFQLGLPSYGGETAHGNCDLCFMKPTDRLLSLIGEQPERAAWWAEQERFAQKLGTATHDGALFHIGRPSYGRMADIVRQQVPMSFVQGGTEELSGCCACTD